MKPTKKPVPYAERLARESVKFGLRVGGSLLRHGPGLFKAGLFGLPIALLGGIGTKRDSELRDDAVEEADAFEVRGDLTYDAHGEVVSPLTGKELDDYNHGLI